MLLPSDEASLFIRLYSELIGFACDRLGEVDGVRDSETFRSAPLQAKANARNRLLENISLVDRFVREGPLELPREIESIVLKWRHFLRGKFILERDLRTHTIFLSQEGPPEAYGVVALNSEFVELYRHPLPALADAVLLPWKGRIVCDGLMSFSNIFFGPGFRRNLKESYKEAKARGIITSLDPDWSPKPPKTPRKPKTPAIQRFLKKCPDGVEEFKDRYGEPRIEIEGDPSREYGVWTPDGQPAFEWDRLMVYPNIIKGKVVYVYCSSGMVANVVATDSTVWRKGDLKPVKGGLLT
jgi:hypothetical protein